MSVHPAREEKPSSHVSVFQNSPSTDGIWVVAMVKIARDCRKTEVGNKKVGTPCSLVIPPSSTYPREAPTHVLKETGTRMLSRTSLTRAKRTPQMSLCLFE